MTDTLVELHQLTVNFDDRPVVDHVDLRVQRGDIITIIGPNGAGKTTLIKAILGIQPVSDGTLTIAPRLTIGYVPQHLTLETTLPLSVRRLLLARALARRPDLLVLDEPAQGVDINGQAALYELIRSLRDELNCGVIMISHDLHLVMAATDKVICLNQHICCSGYPADISHDPAFIETFGRPVAESLAVYHHHHNHSHDLHGDVVSADHDDHAECSHAHH